MNKPDTDCAQPKHWRFKRGMTRPERALFEQALANPDRTVTLTNDPFVTSRSANGASQLLVSAGVFELIKVVHTVGEGWTLVTRTYRLIE